MMHNFDIISWLILLFESSLILTTIILDKMNKYLCHTYVPLQLELSLISTATFLQLLQQIPTQSIFH